MAEHFQERLRDRTILIAEDEYLAANDLAKELDRAGATVVGPFPTTDRALAFLSTSTPDGAILDIDLRGQSVYALADALREMGVPFVFMTGHAGQIVPDRLADVPRCHKPLRVEQAVMLLGEQLGTAGR